MVNPRKRAFHIQLATADLNLHTGREYTAQSLVHFKHSKRNGHNPAGLQLSALYSIKSSLLSQRLPNPAEHDNFEAHKLHRPRLVNQAPPF